MRHTFLSILLSTSVLSFSFAQNSLGINEDALNKSRRLYEQGEYRVVVRMLSEVQNPSIDQQFLLEAGKMRQAGVHSTRLESLVMDFPAHPLVPEASFLLGSYYFSKKDWVQASDYLQVAGDPQALNPDDLSHDAFMKGYLYLQEEAYGKAKASLDQSENLGRSDAALFYYQGLASYYLGKKKEAGSYFEKTKSHAEYGSSSRCFLAQLLFEEGAYQQVIDIAQSEVVDEPSETNAAFYQLVGESYARQDLAVKASIYFEKAIDLSPGVPSPALLYQAGVARFKTGSKEKAIEYFLSSGIQKGAYAQLSAFQLGRIYVDQGEWELALAAYIEAAGLSDPEIREECLFQAGKLFAKQGNYTEAINYFNDYRNEFEDGKWVNEVNDYLTEAYLRTSNYDLAIKHLRDVGVERTAQKRMYQNVTFSKAQLLFNDGLYPEAIRWFDESLLYPIEENLASASHFFKGESYFYLSDYEKAISFYQNVLVKTFEVNYSIGYCYYNLFAYEKAKPFFEKALAGTGSDETLRLDAQRRLADCHYATKSYQEALEQYEAIARVRPSVAITFQMGEVLYALDRREEAKGQFQKVVDGPETSLLDDALFNIAKMDFESANFQESTAAYTKLINRYPESPLIDQSYLNRAISRTNLKQWQDAKDDYTHVLENYPTSPIAFDAILGLQELEQKGEEVDNLERLIDQYKKANPKNTSLEVVEFESAKAQYFKQDYSSASDALEQFLKEYPNSSYQAEASYYLGDAYYRGGLLEKAVKTFEQIPLTQNNKAGRILFRLGDIYYQLADFEQAIATYQKLKSLELTPKDTYNAQVGLLNSNYQMGQFQQCLTLADEILQSEWKPLNAQRNARLMKGKSYYQLNRRKPAATEFKAVVTPSDIVAAEASYYLARVKYDEGSFEASLNDLFALNARFGSYVEWVDRSYLLIADNYIEMDALFQAKATLRSIILHSENEEVKNLATIRLNQIESSEPLDTMENTENRIDK